MPYCESCGENIDDVVPVIPVLQLKQDNQRLMQNVLDALGRSYRAAEVCRLVQGELDRYARDHGVQAHADPQE